MGIVKYIVELSVTIFIAAFLLPEAISAVMYADTTGWNPAVITIFQVLLPILVIVAVALALMPPEVKGKVGL